MMGCSSQQSLHRRTLNLKGTVLQNKGMFMLKPLNNGSNSLRCKVSKSYASMRRSQRRRICKQRMMIRRMSMIKRSSSSAVTESTSSGVERRIERLKKLVPNCNNSINGTSSGLDGLFGETADYIKCLQMKVKIMQTMINLLSPSN